MRVVAQQDGARRAALPADAARLRAHFCNVAKRTELLRHAVCCCIMRNMLLLIMLNTFNEETQTYEAGALPAATATTCSKGRATTWCESSRDRECGAPHTRTQCPGPLMYEMALRHYLMALRH